MWGDDARCAAGRKSVGAFRGTMEWTFRRATPRRTTRRFRLAQTVSATAMGLGHGLQDAQKTMGVIVLALVTAG
jgi:phosphate/sulfate permease